MLFHSNSGYANALPCYVICTLPSLFIIYIEYEDLRITERTVEEEEVAREIKDSQSMCDFRLPPRSR